jgi:REDY-like protein HapK
MPTAFFLTKLKKGADAKEYEKWVQRVDYPLAKKMKSIRSYKVHRINGAFEGQKNYDYIEVLEISDLDSYTRDLGSPEGKQLLGEWSNYIGEYHAVHGEAF